MNPKGRFFAKLVYGFGGSGSNQFNDDEVKALRALIYSLLETISIKLTIITQNNLNSNDDIDINAQNLVICAQQNENGEYEIASDDPNFDGDDRTQYLININRLCLRR